MSVAPSRSLLVGAATLMIAAGPGCDSGPVGAPHTAYYRPVPLGFCPRYIVGGRHAWVVGKLAPGRERMDIKRYEFVFEGYFEKDDKGIEKVRTSCDQRPYPIFHLRRVSSEKLRKVGAPEPRLIAGPGSKRHGMNAAPTRPTPKSKPSRPEPFKPITGPGEGKTLMGPVDRVSGKGHGLAPLPSLKPDPKQKPRRRGRRKVRKRRQ